MGRAVNTSIPSQGKRVRKQLTAESQSVIIFEFGAEILRAQLVHNISTLIALVSSLLLTSVSLAAERFTTQLQLLHSAAEVVSLLFHQFLI